MLNANSTLAYPSSSKESKMSHSIVKSIGDFDMFYTTENMTPLRI